MLKNIFTIICLTIIITASAYIFFQWPTLQFHHNDAEKILVDANKPRILLICLTDVFGGGEVHVTKLYQELRKHHYHLALLTLEQSKFATYLHHNKLPCYTTTIPFSSLLRPLHHVIFTKTLEKICSQDHINIIHCNTRLELPGALATKKTRGTKVVFTRHVPDHMKPSQLYNIDALTAVSEPITDALYKVITQHNISMKHIEHIPALFNAEKFLTYASTQSRKDFFQTLLHKKIHPYPIISMIANFYRSFECKNHPLMVNAVKKLVEKGKPVYVLFAGDGESRPKIESMIQEFGLQEYIHCLGFYSDTPALLYHSDMMVLTSKNEALGIVYLEAGLMKKPAIGAYGTGAESTLVHEKTGLLFKNNDVDDLVAQIERLIDNPAYAHQLGAHACEHVMAKFNPDVTFKKFVALYENI